MRCSPAQNVPKTKVERVKLVEIAEALKERFNSRGLRLSSCCSTRKHQIRYKIPKLEVTGSIPVARPKILKQQPPIDFTLTVDSTGLKLG